MKKILVINGHPNKLSFCDALAKAYTKGALRSGSEVVLLNLYDLQFNPNFEGSYSKEGSSVEADILEARKKIG